MYDQRTADLERELGDLQATGDLMQSSLSRVATWIEENAGTIPAMGYENGMALLEGRTAVDEWTRIRRRATAAHHANPLEGTERP